MNELHDHKQQLGSSSDLLANLQESGRSEERKVTRCHKETWASPSTKETCAGTIILTPRNASLFSKRTIPTNEKKWKVIHAHSREGRDLAVSVTSMVTTMLRHFDQEERQTNGLRYWNSTKPVLMRAFCTQRSSRL